MKPIVRLAIIGCGMISRFHIDAIRQIKTAELAGVYDPRTEAAERVAAEQAVRAYRSLDELWNDRSVDAVCISVRRPARMERLPLTRCAMANMCSLKSLWRL